jgi:hypothetical protein
MKNIRYLLFAVLGILFAGSCKNDELAPGNPVLSPKTEFGSARFGDSLQFTAGVSDADVPLSTLKAQLFFGDEKVSETVIRTKTSADYSGKIFIPYYANIPNAKATLKLVLQNIHFTVVEQVYSLDLTRPDFTHLTLVAENGDEYRMERTDLYSYTLTDYLPAKIKAYIRTPKMGEQGNELFFGWENNTITQGSTTFIPFSSSQTGVYSISFNTFDYSASPFLRVLFNGEEMEMIDDNNYRISKSLAKGQKITVEGILDIEDWWIDPDFFTQADDGSFTFMPISGEYRITANYQYKYFVVETLKDGSLATLQTDGSGAIWIIGDGIGKPSVAGNQVGWNTDKALCMAPVAQGKYQVTVVGDKSISTGSINFKFFHQKGWGGEFGGDVLSTTSELILVGDGSNGRDPGNLGLVAGKTLESQAIYVFTLDVSAGNANAVLTVEKKGIEETPQFNAKFNGVDMLKVDADNYKVENDFTTGQQITVTGISNIRNWWIDPDYFTMNDDKLTFLPVSGRYRVTANVPNKYFRVEKLDGANTASLQADGTGAIWVIGEGIGKPSLGNEVGWNDGKALCMAQHEARKFQITLVGGTNLRMNDINFKFFGGQNWGNEFSGDKISTTSELILIGNGSNGRDSGNLGLISDKTFGGGKIYVFTIDVSAGTSNAVLTVVQK